MTENKEEINPLKTVQKLNKILESVEFNLNNLYTGFSELGFVMAHYVSMQRKKLPGRRRRERI